MLGENMKKSKTKEEKYMLTFKGFLSLYMQEEQMDIFFRDLTSLLYNNNSNAILIDNNGGEFISVERESKSNSK